ncbi:calcium-dependent protein kinase 3-like [Adelges cooleyi]|uniref:calcium-dependent protein kinase 3-like n=1 Tax=Adelges cooleyi TaxID=133065 RepID=UPI00217F6A7C|nr:calcium-dependent protein kinase 3-like [Adelges cooleyi]
MFSKNIMLLLWVVCFTVKNSDAGKINDRAEKALTVLADEDSTRTVKKNLDDITDKQWDNLLNHYGTEQNGSISPKGLQKLVFDEFRGFLTARHAEIYAKLLNAKDNYKIELEQLKKMKPIIYFLTLKESLVENENVNKNETFSRESSVNIIKKNADAKILFSDENEISEILDLIGQNENSRIEWTKLEEILKMVADSLSMAYIYKGFSITDKDEDGVRDVNDRVNVWMGTDSEKNDTSEESAVKISVTKMIMEGDLNHDGLIDFYEYMVKFSNDFKQLRAFNDVTS